MTTGPTIRRHQSKQDYETPDDFIQAVEKRFGKIEVDLAANSINTKAQFFFPPETDSLIQKWPVGEICWLNPPFDNITDWACKCSMEAERGCRILFLTPASIGSNWFRDFIYNQAMVMALNGRLTFKGCTAPYPKDCILSAYNFPTWTPGFQVWNWRDK